MRNLCELRVILTVRVDQTEKEQKDVPLQKFYTQRAKGEEIRQLGLVLVPGAHIKQCCVRSVVGRVPLKKLN